MVKVFKEDDDFYLIFDGIDNYLFLVDVIKVIENGKKV